ncbi:MAG: FMN-binding negative transcriptional regulator [Chitinophagaceae bacterium]
MYNLKHFKANSEADVIAFMHQHPFIILCGVDENNKPVATHIPVLIEERNDKLILLAHIMRKQLHTIAFEKNSNVLAIFSAAHCYVSATNYEHQYTASTWNYQAVHASGTLRFLDDEALYNLLVKLTEKFENNPTSTALVQKMDKQYVADNMKAIVAFEIEITHIEHVFKLSQNKDAATRKKIINSLEQMNNDDTKNVATAMRKNEAEN